MIIAVDPGKMCGLFIVTASGDVHLADELDPYETIARVERTVDAYLHWQHRVRLVVCERYVITKATIKMTRQYDALETIGALRYVARTGGARFELQGRENRKSVSRNVLRSLDWYRPSVGGHMVAAAQHCLLAFARHWPQHDLVRRATGMI